MIGLGCDDLGKGFVDTRRRGERRKRGHGLLCDSSDGAGMLCSRCKVYNRKKAMTVDEVLPDSLMLDSSLLYITS